MYSLGVCSISHGFLYTLFRADPATPYVPLDRFPRGVSPAFPVHSPWAFPCVFPVRSLCVPSYISRSFTVCSLMSFLVRYSVHSLWESCNSSRFPFISRVFPKRFLCMFSNEFLYGSLMGPFNLFAVASMFLTPRVSYAVNG